MSSSGYIINGTWVYTKGQSLNQVPPFKVLRGLRVWIIQLKNWFSIFWMAMLIRSDKGPTFASAKLKRLCDKYCAGLNLTALYNTTPRALVRQRGELGWSRQL